MQNEGGRKMDEGRREGRRTKDEGSGMQDVTSIFLVSEANGRPSSIVHYKSDRSSSVVM
jgi:hypothetical protein